MIIKNEKYTNLKINKYFFIFVATIYGYANALRYYKYFLGYSIRSDNQKKWRKEWESA